ncbi:MAG: 2-dehydropantoate 2-reductase [Gammaproteobacteria bacterium]|nr:2-dehydropantoate 2-reductase [Gammaproteobacteria bacterium]
MVNHGVPARRFAISTTPPSLTSSTKPLWHVLGVGAMGCLWAARLHQWSAKAVLMMRDSRQVETYSALGGLSIENEGSVTTLPVPATSPQSCTSITHLLVATKAQDVEVALAGVKHLLTSDARIVLLQNGLKVQRIVSAAFGPERVWCLSTSAGAWLRAPFHVVAAGQGETWLGQLDYDSAEQGMLQSLPGDAMGIRYDPAIENRLWRKLAANCAINALTALYNCRNGELLSLPGAYRELISLCAEIGAIVHALPGAPSMPDIEELVKTILKATADNYSSTLQDIRKGRSTEIDHLNGYLCELAQKHGLDCSVNQQILTRFKRLCESKGID